MNVFCHSGDLGDIIYSLPTIRALGGGKLILFHYPGRTSHGMSKAKVDRIRPLLEKQEYIESVEWSDQLHDHSLNGFRDHSRVGNLADMHLATHGLSWEYRTEKWLNNIEPLFKYKVIIQRSQRYHGQSFPWGAIVNKYKGNIGFLGFPEEHGLFSLEFGEVPFVEANNLLEIAQIIAGSSLFIGNQSSPLAIAEGMKHTLIHEICPGPYHHLCVFQRVGCVIGWDSKVELPEIT